MRQIFVFGSNVEGRHGKGAALEARKKHGAKYGQARGLQGNSYAIVTKELRKHDIYTKPTISSIRDEVETFLQFAKDHRDWNFIVSPIGCGLAGFTPGQIAPLFKGYPYNVHLPPEFIRVLHVTNWSEE